MNQVFGVPTWGVGVLVGLLTWAVIIGGITSIGRVAAKLAPLEGVAVPGRRVRRHRVVRRPDPDVSPSCFEEAWTMQSAMGFGMFVAMRYGIARSIYANEAGYGTAAVAYGTARTDSPTAQGSAGHHRGLHRVVRHDDD